MVVELNLELEHKNVMTAFLYEELKKTIYMKQPGGYEEGEERIMFVN